MKRWMIFASALPLACLALASPSQGAPAAAKPRTATAITCNWPVGPNDSARDLVRRFGRQARIGQIDAGEGEMEPGVTLFPNDPHRRMWVHFQTDAMRRPSRLIFTDDHAPWSVAGIRIGDSLESVVRRNGRPLDMQQFASDESGRLNSFAGGRLETVLGRCWPAMYFTPADGADYPGSLMGDGVVRSDHPDMAKARAHVNILGVEFP